MTAAFAPLGCRSEKGNMKPVKVLAFRQRRAGWSAGKAIYTKYLTPPSPRAPNVHIPHSDAGRQEFGEMIGRDAHALLDAVYNWSDVLVNKELGAVEVLRRIVVQQFYLDERGIHWRTELEGTPPSIIFINSPYDLEAHYGKSDNCNGRVTRFM